MLNRNIYVSQLNAGLWSAVALTVLVFLPIKCHKHSLMKIQTSVTQIYIFFKSYTQNATFRGGIYLKPQKFEHIFVAVITFPPFFCANTFVTACCLLCML